MYLSMIELFWKEMSYGNVYKLIYGIPSDHLSSFVYEVWTVDSVKAVCSELKYFLSWFNT